jgi:uncharacterized membrane protein
VCSSDLPTGRGTLALKVLPLTLPLPGLLKHRLYTYRWLSMVIWLYFAEGVIRGTGLDTGIGPVLAWTQAALCLLLFGVCAAHVRWRFKRKLLR